MSDRQRKDWEEICRAITDKVPVNVENAIIEVTTELRHCIVARELNFINCIVRGSFTATRVTFAESISFVDTIFEDGLDLGGCSINGNLVAQNVECRSSADFEGISITGLSFFEQCTFKTNPNFTMASFGPYTSIEGSTFEDGATFISATFAGHLILADIPKCVGEFDLTWAAIGATLNANDCVFDGDLTCCRARVNGTVLISETRFGPDAALNLEQTAVGADVVIQKCVFAKVIGNCLNLESISVSGGCKIERVTCQGGFTMFNSKVSRYLWIGTFDSVDNPATKHETYFFRNFNLSSLRLDGYFWCTGTVFESEGKAAPPDFTDVKIDGQTYIMFCEFKGGANFNRADFRGVFGTNAVFTRQVTFEGSHFLKGVRFLPSCSFADGIEFYFAEFDQEANFGGAKIRKRISLRYAQFRHSLLFELKGSEQGEHDIVDFQDDAGNKVIVELRGCSYARLVLPYEFERLQEFIDRVPEDDKNSLIYLEQYLLKSGRREYADRVRYHRNLLEGLRMPKFRLGWCMNRLHKYITHYGTIVSPLLLFALVLAVFGLLVDYVPHLDSSWTKIIQTLCWAVAGFVITLSMDAVRRKIWPE